MKRATARKVIFHGEFADKYIPELTIYADSLFAACTIIFKHAFPDLINEPLLEVLLEDAQGNKTELFDPEQVLGRDQTIIHILPKSEGGVWAQIAYAVITMIIAYGIAMLLAPKIPKGSTSGSGNNFDSVENVIGQGGAIPIVLGTRGGIGSRVVSHGIGSTLYKGKANTYV